MSLSLPTDVRNPVRLLDFVLFAGLVSGLGFVIVSGVESGHPALAILFSICAALLGFFHLLIARMLKRGHPSARELMGRTMTFWWMLLLFILAMSLHPAFVAVLVGGASALALVEYTRMVASSEKQARPRIPKTVVETLLGTLLSAFFCAYHGSYSAFTGATLLPVLFVVPIILILREDTEHGLFFFNTALTAGLLFIFALGHGLFLFKLNSVLFLLTVFLTEVRDLISYWVGKFLAKAASRSPSSRALQLMTVKIAARVSPNKTWATGTIAALATVGLAFALAPLAEGHGGQPLPPPLVIALWGAGIGVWGLMGDLFFSLLKRAEGVKDSGHWLPGQTGIIDRIDSLVLTIPLSLWVLELKF